MKLHKMNLVGHSLGGYVCTKYAANYPDRVSRLLLLSPMGVEENSRETIESFKHPDVEDSWIKKKVFAFAKCLLRRDRSPLDALRCLGRFVAPFFIKDTIRKKFFSIPDEDYNKLYPYLYQITMANGSGEYAMSRFIEPNLIPYEPLYHDLHFLKSKGIPITVAYGDSDYVNTKFNGNLISETLQQEGFEVYIVPKSSHQVYLENPDD
jgi:cardiolipin-specific phospholipase